MSRPPYRFPNVFPRQSLIDRCALMHMNASIPLTRDMTWGDIKEIVAESNIPDTAKPSVSVQSGDRPWDADTTTLKFNWST